MGAFLKQAVTLIAGNMAGSNQKAKFVVKTFRAAYISSAGAIAFAWYSAYRNERVEPGTGKFPFPGLSQLKRQFKPDRPEQELPHEQTPAAASNSGGLMGTLPNVSGSYVFPFTDKATWGRIDQGVDFGGTGPIFSPTDAKVIQTGAPGWPGESGLVLEILNGPRAGHFIYIFEGINVMVKRNQIVKAGQTVGSFIPFSSTGIEIGFCDGSGTPISHGEYTEGKVTRGGKEMAAFLHQIKFNKPKQAPQSRVIQYSPGYLQTIGRKGH
jgi:murein DD-endopeptidase MepM/ murein hydrolase activator NlpD